MEIKKPHSRELCPQTENFINLASGLELAVVRAWCSHIVPQ